MARNGTPPNNLPTHNGKLAGNGTHVTFDDLTPRYGFQWCPGCGNFAVLNALKFLIVDEGLDPTQMVCVSDIGQNGKLPMWINVYGFHGLHGRALPFAQGVKLANPKLNVFTVLGDGGCYAEGTNHFVHACRRNVDLTAIVHNNSVFALTTGQASPTTLQGTATKTTPVGAFEPALNPLQVAIASGATFVARTFTGDPAHLQETIRAAFAHKGFALVDVLQPCVVWNSVQTWQSWERRVQRIDPKKHDPSNLTRAYELAGQDWNGTIPIGILFRKERPTFESQVSELASLPLVDRDVHNVDIDPLLNELMGREQPDSAD